MPVSDDRAAISHPEPFPPTTSAAQPPTHPPAPPQASPTLPSRYTLRSRPDRLSWVAGQGGGRDTERAVEAALEWLAAAQEPDGRWNANRHGAGQERRVLGHDRRGAGTNADTGITGLAVLAFLGAGHSHQQGDYQTTVARGLEFLIRQQDTTGDLGGNASLYARMYCHSMAAFAITEALAMTGDARLRPAAQRALTYSLRAQHPGTGGWRYRVGDTGDTSQLGWQVMALSSAEHAGLRVPWSAWDGVQRFLDSVARGSEGGLASYRPDSPASRAMTAEAFYCRQVVGTMGGRAHGRRAADEATRAVLGEMPHEGRINLYYWYYATLALHHAQTQNDAALSAWDQWNTALKRVLVTTQEARGSQAGSWSPETVWGGYGGRVYSTALAAMCLEVYYRYPASGGR